MTEQTTLWKTVLREPTDEMLWAGYQADAGSEKTFEEFMALCPGWRDAVRTIWRAMLGAAQ